MLLWSYGGSRAETNSSTGVRKVCSLYPTVKNQVSAQSDHTGISSSDTQKISSLTIGCSSGFQLKTHTHLKSERE